MDEHFELTDIWKWLPTFRVVAETEHLPTASERLHVTPAAISRTLGLLEDRLGRKLFNRTGKRLVLNADGRALLAAVTDAMESVEEGLETLEDSTMKGPVRVSSVGVLTNHYVVPALTELVGDHDELKPQVRNLRTRQAVEKLLQGTIDVAFVYESLTVEGLRVQRLGVSRSSIYCGRGHPLFDRRAPEFEEILDHPFSVPQIGDTGQVMDGWPVDVDRTVGMRITLLTSNLEVSLSGRFLTVLPDVTARPHVERGQLRRFDFDIVDPAVLFAVRREAGEAAEGRARGVVEAVAGRVEAVEDEIAQFREETSRN